MSPERDEKDSLDLPDWMRPFVIVGLLVAVMWAVEVVDLLPHTNFDRWGIRPRSAAGLVGIVTAPFLHSGFPHLIGNTIPFLVLGGLIAIGGAGRFLQVTVVVGLVCGVGTWLVGPAHTDHIGASGLVFGFLTYLVGRGLFDRKPGFLVLGVIVLFLYGGVLWGLLPRPGVSWQGHLFGAIGGVLAAWMIHADRTGERTKGSSGSQPGSMPVG
jgi:membrane associated rhomboid family serine protease